MAGFVARDKIRPAIREMETIGDLQALINACLYKTYTERGIVMKKIVAIHYEYDSIYVGQPARGNGPVVTEIRQVSMNGQMSRVPVLAVMVGDKIWEEVPNYLVSVEYDITGKREEESLRAPEWKKMSGIPKEELAAWKNRVALLPGDSPIGPLEILRLIREVEELQAKNEELEYKNESLWAENSRLKLPPNSPGHEIF